MQEFEKLKLAYLVCFWRCFLMFLLEMKTSLEVFRKEKFVLLEIVSN
jgi:hypothetical protein